MRTTREKLELMKQIKERNQKREKEFFERLKREKTANNATKLRKNCE